MTTTINVGDIWKRRVECFDGYDLIRVCEIIETDGELPDEYTICPHPEFGNVIGTTAEGITEHCDLVTSGDPEQADWETQVADG